MWYHSRWWTQRTYCLTVLLSTWYRSVSVLKTSFTPYIASNSFSWFVVICERLYSKIIVCKSHYSPGKKNQILPTVNPDLPAYLNLSALCFFPSLIISFLRVFQFISAISLCTSMSSSWKPFELQFSIKVNSSS